MKQREFTKEFKREAVHILVKSGLRVVAATTDLGIGKSLLDRWRRLFDEQGLLAGRHTDVPHELARLLCENKPLRQERDLLNSNRTDNDPAYLYPCGMRQSSAQRLKQIGKLSNGLFSC